MVNMTEFEWREHERRLSARKVANSSGAMAIAYDEPANGKTLQEAEIHAEIVNYCKSKGWLAFHGSMAHRAMRNPGEPDFCVVMDYGIVLFVEVKRDKRAKVSIEQLATLAMLKKLGANACIVHSLTEFLAEVEKVKNPNK